MCIRMYILSKLGTSGWLLKHVGVHCLFHGLKFFNGTGGKTGTVLVIIMQTPSHVNYKCETRVRTRTRGFYRERQNRFPRAPNL